MIVYLDSNIISQSAVGLSPVVKLIRESNCRIKIASSISHIVEALPKNENFVDEAVERIRIITDKSIAVPVYPFIEIFKIESNSKLPLAFKDFVCDWHNFLLQDNFEDHISNIIKNAKNYINIELEKIPDANLRRKKRAEIILRGKIRREVLAPLIEVQRNNAIEQTRDNLPELTPFFLKGGLYDVLLGKSDKEKVALLLKETLIHPVVIAKLAFHPDLDIAPVSRHFWIQADKFQKIIQTQVLYAAEIQLRHQVDFQIFFRMMEDHFRSDTFLQHVFSKIFEYSREEHKFCALGSLNFINMMTGICLKKIHAHSNPRKLREFLAEPKIARGDFGDMTHTMYQPYVDLFCCDRRTKQVLLNSRSQIDNICTSEDELMHKMQLYLSK